MNRRALLPSPPGRGCPEGAGEGQSKWKHALPQGVLQNARELRSRLTDAEQLLWYLLRSRRFGGFKFRRQHPVPPFVLDFYCEELKLGVELDGGQHNEDAQAVQDEKRTHLLAQHGIRIVRFWNHDVLNRTEDVLTELWNLAVAQDSPSPRAARDPLPGGEGKGMHHV